MAAVSSSRKCFIATMPVSSDVIPNVEPTAPDVGIYTALRFCLTVPFALPTSTELSSTTVPSPRKFSTYWKPKAVCTVIGVLARYVAMSSGLRK